MNRGAVSVVIPNFQGESLLPGCLEALEAQSTPPAEVVVVDNGSTDRSCAMVESRFPAVRLIRIGRNLGFGAAANRGVAATSGDRVAVLNSDAQPAPDWLAVVLDAPAPPAVWAWGSVLVSAETGLIESAGDAYSERGAAYKLARGWSLADLPAEPYEVFAAPGAAPVFRRDVFDRLGGYDEHFFLYYEDVDLAFRARRLGHRALMVPGARVTHALAASSRDRIFRLRYLVARNALWCAARNHPRFTWRRALRSALYDIRHDRPRRYIPALMAGTAAGFAGLPRALREREELARTTSVEDADLLAAFLPPAELDR